MANIAKHRVIIDTDPGVDDVLAMLYAFSARPELLEVLMISVTFGNVEVESCVRNILSMFHVIEQEMKYRQDHGRPAGFEGLKRSKPIVAAGASQPLIASQIKADHFHGIDGLGGIHTMHPQYSALKSWVDVHGGDESLLFRPSRDPSPDLMLSLLRDNPPNTVSIIAVGPLTNLALAAAKDPETFLRAKEVVCMGGNISVPGNISPVAEFNIYADPVAAARLFALTSTHPRTTHPYPTDTSALGPPPARLSKPLTLHLYALDLTTQHNLTRATVDTLLTPLLLTTPTTTSTISTPSTPSPLAHWTSAILAATFSKLTHLYGPSEPLSLHDPCCVLHMLGVQRSRAVRETDVRVETGGQWARGACVVDGRGRGVDGRVHGHGGHDDDDDDDDNGGVDAHDASRPGDEGGWMGGKGNRVLVVEKTGYEETFGHDMLKQIFGL